MATKYIVNNVSGQTITGDLTTNTISATTYFNLPDNVTGNYLPLSGGTVTGQTFFTSGLTITGDTIITDSTGTSTAINTSTRELVDSSAFVSVDWRTRLLYNGAGNATINYDGALLYDSTSIPSVDWINRQTYDDLGVLSIDWQYGRRRLYDVSSNESLDWDIRTLTKSDGTTVSFDWENGILTGQTNIESSTISATTISGTTLYGDGSNLTGIGGGSSYIYEVGEYVVSEGGVIAHRWISTSSFGPPSGGTVQNYLVLATTDLSTATVWSTGTTNISDVESFWDGLTNTNNLISAGDALGITPTSAAGLCYNSTNNGKTDWYLPSIGELAKVNSNRWEISQGLSIAGGTQIGYAVYWSSTEYTGILAWAFNFESSVTTLQTKTISSYDVRAIRKFSI